LAVGGFEETGDQPQRRGLAAAGRAEQADQLSMVDFQGDVIDHRKRAKSLGQAAQIHRRQSPRSHSCSCTDQRPAWYASIRTKTGWERELKSPNPHGEEARSAVSNHESPAATAARLSSFETPLTRLLRMRSGSLQA